MLDEVTAQTQEVGKLSSSMIKVTLMMLMAVTLAGCATSASDVTNEVRASYGQEKLGSVDAKNLDDSTDFLMGAGSVALEIFNIVRFIP